MTNQGVYQHGEMIPITGMNQLQVMQLCISFNKVHHLFIKDRK